MLVGSYQSLIRLKAKGGTLWEVLLTSTLIASVEYLARPAGQENDQRWWWLAAWHCNKFKCEGGGWKGALLEIRLGDRSIFPSDWWRQGSGAENWRVRSLQNTFINNWWKNQECVYGGRTNCEYTITFLEGGKKALRGKTFAKQFSAS